MPSSNHSGVRRSGFLLKSLSLQGIQDSVWLENYFRLLFGVLPVFFFVAVARPSSPCSLLEVSLPGTFVVMVLELWNNKSKSVQWVLDSRERVRGVIRSSSQTIFFTAAFCLGHCLLTICCRAMPSTTLVFDKHWALKLCDGIPQRIQNECKRHGWGRC